MRERCPSTPRQRIFWQHPRWRDQVPRTPSRTSRPFAGSAQEVVENKNLAVAVGSSADADRWNRETPRDLFSERHRDGLQHDCERTHLPKGRRSGEDRDAVVSSRPWTRCPPS